MVVEYRMKKLESEGLIKGYVTLIDTQRLGYFSYYIHITLTKFTQKKLEQIIAYLKEHPYVKWIARSSGRWDLVINVTARGREHLDEILPSVYTDIGDHIGNIDIFPCIKLIKKANLNIFQTDRSEVKKFNKTTALPKLDQKDIALLEILSEDARASAVKIGKYIGLTPEAVAYRLRKWKKDGLIRDFRTVISIPKLGFSWFMVMADIKALGKEKEKQVNAYLRENENIFYADKIIGKWNYRIQILSKDHQDFHNIMVEIRNNLSGFLNSYELLILFEDHHQISIPKGILDDLRSD